MAFASVDRFVSAEVDRGGQEDGQFDAQMYSFFSGAPSGNDALDGALDGSLEDGLDGCLEDDASLLSVGFNGYRDSCGQVMSLGDEDLSLASMLRDRFNMGDGLMAPGHSSAAPGQGTAAASSAHDHAARLDLQPSPSFQDAMDDMMASATSQHAVCNVLQEDSPPAHEQHHSLAGAALQPSPMMIPVSPLFSSSPSPAQHPFANVEGRPGSLNSAGASVLHDPVLLPSPVHQSFASNDGRLGSLTSAGGSLTHHDPVAMLSPAHQHSFATAGEGRVPSFNSSHSGAMSLAPGGSLGQGDSFHAAHTMMLHHPGSVEAPPSAPATPAHQQGMQTNFLQHLMQPPPSTPPQPQPAQSRGPISLEELEARLMAGAAAQPPPQTPPFGESNSGPADASTGAFPPGATPVPTTLNQQFFSAPGVPSPPPPPPLPQAPSMAFIPGPMPPPLSGQYQQHPPQMQYAPHPQPQQQYAFLPPPPPFIMHPQQQLPMPSGPLPPWAHAGPAMGLDHPQQLYALHGPRGPHQGPPGPPGAGPWRPQPPAPPSHGPRPAYHQQHTGPGQPYGPQGGGGVGHYHAVPPPPVNGQHPPMHLMARPPGGTAMHPQSPASSRSGPSSGHRIRPGGAWMSSDEVGYIMNIMLSAVSSGSPYVEDYYHQAYINSHFNARNASLFRPVTLRDLSHELARLDPTTSVKFVDVAGLGKLVYSNIRTPRVLMDIDSNGGAKDALAGVAQSRPLDQEPLLAARIMVEDCMGLLLDVDDIDRLLASSGARQHENAAALAQRRALLMTGIVASFHLPNTPGGEVEAGETAAAAGGEASGAAAAPLNDGVFLRVMELHKGRALVARALRLARPAPPPVPADAASPDLQSAPAHPGAPAAHQRLLWAVLRNARHLFGTSLSPSAASSGDPNLVKGLAAATTRIATAITQLVQRTTDGAELALTLQAFLAGLRAAPHASPLVPLVSPGHSAQGAEEVWLGDALATIVSRGEELGLTHHASPSSAAGGSAAPAVASGAWSSAVHALSSVLLAHVESEQASSSSGPTPSVTCRPLAQALLRQLNEERRSELQKVLLGFHARGSQG